MYFVNWWSKGQQQEPWHHLVLNCLNHTFPVIQFANSLPPCFMKKCKIEKSSIIVPVKYCQMIYQFQWDKTNWWHMFFLLTFLWSLVVYSTNRQCWWQKVKCWQKLWKNSINKLQIRINPASTRPSLIKKIWCDIIEHCCFVEFCCYMGKRLRQHVFYSKMAWPPTTYDVISHN